MSRGGAGMGGPPALLSPPRPDQARCSGTGRPAEPLPGDCAAFVQRLARPRAAQAAAGVQEAGAPPVP